jgi:hypothetical protein
LLPLPLQVARL